MKLELANNQDQPIEARIIGEGTYLDRFKTLQLCELIIEDIEPGDRVVVTTTSGNRHMLRYSTTAGRVKTYNENRGEFESGEGHIVEFIKEARVGKPLVLGIEMGGEIGLLQSTPIEKIEIRLKVDETPTAEKETELGGQRPSFRKLSQALLESMDQQGED